MRWWPWGIEARALEAARAVRIGDEVHPGDVVKVVGVVRAEGPLLEAPVSGRKRCVWWDAVVKEPGLFPSFRVRDAQMTPFVVVAGELRARVRTRPLLRAPRSRKTTGRSARLRGPPAQVEAFLKERGKSAHARASFLSVPRMLSYVERRIEDSDIVAVVGRVTGVEATRVRPVAGDGTQAYREAPGEVTAAMTLELDVLAEGWVLLSLAE